MEEDTHMRALKDKTQKSALYEYFNQMKEKRKERDV